MEKYFLGEEMAKSYGGLEEIIEGQGLEISKVDEKPESVLIETKDIVLGIEKKKNGRYDIGCGVSEIRGLADLEKLVVIGKEIGELFADGKTESFEYCGDGNKLNGLGICFSGELKR